MADRDYIALVLVVSVAVTVTLRALPFLAKTAMKDSLLLADLGRWLPPGAVTILAAYCVTLTDFSNPSRAAGPLVGVAATVWMHLWRRNIVVSIVLGTAACLAITNWPG